jgi:hypothetical protein
LGIYSIAKGGGHGEFREEIKHFNLSERRAMSEIYKIVFARRF